MNDLVPLCRRINEREETIEKLRSQAVSKVNDTLREALLQGQDLQVIKRRLPHGAWLNWLRLNCPKLSLRRAQRYMALVAKAPTAAILTEADSLRQALALCELEGEQCQEEPKHWPPYLETIHRVSKLIGYISRYPITSWPMEGLDKCREELLPLATALWPDRFHSIDPR